MVRVQHDPFNQHSVDPTRGPVGLGIHQIHGAVTMCDFLITCTKEFLLGVAMVTPIVVMLATYDQWFPIVRGWIA